MDDSILEKMIEIGKTDDGNIALRELFVSTCMIVEGVCKQDDDMINLGIMKHVVYSLFNNKNETIIDFYIEPEIITAVSDAHSTVIGMKFDPVQLNEVFKSRIYKVSEDIKSAINKIKESATIEHGIGGFEISKYLINTGKENNDIETMRTGINFLYCLETLGRGPDLFDKEIADKMAAAISTDGVDSDVWETMEANRTELMRCVAIAKSVTILDINGVLGKFAEAVFV